MSFQLHIRVTGQPEETVVPLADGDHLVGRSHTADIRLTQPDVSGKHLLLHVDGDSVIAENLSSHGARAGQVTLELPTPIRVGDSLYLGQSTVITLGSDAEPPQEEPSPEMTMMTAMPLEPEPKPEPAPTPAPEPKPEPQPEPAPQPDIEATILEAPAPKVAPVEDDAMKTVPPDADVTILEAPAPKIAPVEDDGLKTVAPDADVTILEAPAPKMAPPADDAMKTVAPDIEATIVDAPAPKAAPAEASEDDVFKTNVMQTRIASAEELDFLRRQDRKTKRGKKLKYILPILGGAIVLGLVFFLKGNPPEEKLTWPLRADGKYSEKAYDPQGGGHAAGRFSLIAPLTELTESKIDQNGDLVVQTMIGRDRDVPLRLVLSCKHSPGFLHESRSKTFRDWMREIAASGGHWNFDQPSDLFFIGRNNGLPCLSAAYTREIDHQSWYGEALFFRNGDERIVRMAEIPNAERLRGADFLAGNPFLFTSPAFIENHWEGSDTLVAGDPEDLLQEAKGLLLKMSPATWDKITMLLRSTLVQATEQDREALKEDALNQLRKLRGNQNVWYNAQMIAYLKEKAADNIRGAELIRDSCLAVFSSEDDLRHRNIQRNIWE